jgi:hypothetical protein
MGALRVTRRTAFSALRDGISRVSRAPAILGGVWAVTLLVSVPLALAVRAAVARHLGASLSAESAATGVNFDWLQEFQGQATGIGTTLTPSVLGFAAVLDNLSGFLDNVARPAAVVSAAAVYLLLWVFLAGGIIDRLARDRPMPAHGFFGVSGAFFFRFLRLGAGMAIVYGLLFGQLHPYLFDRLYRRLIENVTDERVAFAIRFSLYGLFGVLLAIFNVVFDYAKVRAVVEDRRSMLGAVVAAVRFVRRNGRAVAALFAMNFALFVGTLVVYAAIAPGAGSTGWTMWIGVAIGQLYIIARLWVKLVFWASEVALFQRRLAHAGYVSTAVPPWPDPPEVEAVLGDRR